MPESSVPMAPQAALEDSVTKVDSSPFFFVCCQEGAEHAVKEALCGPDKPFRMAFSRPGFLTMKSEFSVPLWSPAVPENPFIRCSGHALGSVQGESAELLINEIFEKYGSIGWENLHIWQRDIAVPGWNNFEPGRSALAKLVADQFSQRLQNSSDDRFGRVNQIANWGERVLNIVLIEPNYWWVGTHVADKIHRRWPGGVFMIDPPEEMISRAYLKIAEAMAWSQLPFQRGDAIVEIGSSPGGACQYMLDQGFKVTGIDPAEMDPTVSANPSFEHIRARSLQVKRKVFSKFRWLVCDANVAPNYTLDTVEGIVTYPSNAIEGLLLTIKLSEWSKATEVSSHLERVSSWGYKHTMARQLSYNRREYCIAAWK